MFNRNQQGFYSYVRWFVLWLWQIVCGEPPASVWEAAGRSFSHRATRRGCAGEYAQVRVWHHRLASRLSHYYFQLSLMTWTSVESLSHQQRTHCPDATYTMWIVQVARSELGARQNEDGRAELVALRARRHTSGASLYAHSRLDRCLSAARTGDLEMELLLEYCRFVQTVKAFSWMHYSN